MKHGPIALIDENLPVVVLAPREPRVPYEKIVGNMEEVRARGGKVIAVVDEDDTQVASLADDVIRIPAELAHARVPSSPRCRCSCSRTTWRTCAARTWISRGISRRASRWSDPRSGSSARDRLPSFESLGDQLCALPIVPAVESAQVGGVRAQVHTGGPRLRSRVCASDPIPRRAIGGLQTDLPGPLDLRCSGVPGPFPPPEIEDPEGSVFSFAASLQYRADKCHPSARIDHSAPARRSGLARRGAGSGRTALAGHAPSASIATTDRRCERRAPHPRWPSGASR